MTSPIHNCEISDSFVRPIMKLSGGKNGNGESRLFISNNKEFANKLLKPWKVTFDNTYITDVEEYVKNNEDFKKPCEKRFERFCDNIEKLKNSGTISVAFQNGDNDVNRNYIAQYPHRKTKDKTNEDKKNIKKWDIFRECLMPMKTTLEFYDKDTYINVVVKYNQNVHKYNKIHGCSFAQLEFMRCLGMSQNIEIQTGKTSEFALRNPENGYKWPVDGYHECGKHHCSGTKETPCQWNKYVFEFQGDYWHKNKREKDRKKKEYYTREGYKWFEINESEWNNRKKVIKKFSKN